MSPLKNDILPATVYNTLPHVHRNYDVPEDNSADIADLTQLLNKHSLFNKIWVKLIYIYFLLKKDKIFISQIIIFL